MKSNPQMPLNKPPIIAALHLPPMIASRAPRTFSVSQIIEFTLRNIECAVSAGINTVYIQDVGDRPVPKEVQPHTIASLTAIGIEVRRSFPELTLGISLMSNGARAPLAIAQACGAKFIRIKVYMGVMVKPEGIIEGCAYDAIQYRSMCEAENIQILADVYDRTGEPLGRLPMGEAARQAVQLGRADGLVITGGNYNETIQMIKEVRSQNLTAPIFAGGGTSVENIKEVLQIADGVIVSSSLTSGVRMAEGMPSEWDPEKMRAFVINAGLAT